MDYLEYGLEGAMYQYALSAFTIGFVIHGSGYYQTMHQCKKCYSVDIIEIITIQRSLRDTRHSTRPAKPA